MRISMKLIRRSKKLSKPFIDCTRLVRFDTLVPVTILRGGWKKHVASVRRITGCNFAVCSSALPICNPSKKERRGGEQPLTTTSLITHDFANFRSWRKVYYWAVRIPAATRQ